MPWQHVIAGPIAKLNFYLQSFCCVSLHFVALNSHRDPLKACWWTPLTMIVHFISAQIITMVQTRLQRQFSPFPAAKATELALVLASRAPSWREPLLPLVFLLGMFTRPAAYDGGSRLFHTAIDMKGFEKDCLKALCQPAILRSLRSPQLKGRQCCVSDT